MVVVCVAAGRVTAVVSCVVVVVVVAGTGSTTVQEVKATEAAAHSNARVSVFFIVI